MTESPGHLILQNSFELICLVFKVINISNKINTIFIKDAVQNLPERLEDDKKIHACSIDYY